MTGWTQARTLCRSFQCASIGSWGPPRSTSRIRTWWRSGVSHLNHEVSLSPKSGCERVPGSKKIQQTTSNNYCISICCYKKLLLAISGILPFLNKPGRICFLRSRTFESPVDSIVLATTFLNWNLIRRCKLQHCLFLFRGQYFNPRSFAVAICPRSTGLWSCITGVWLLVLKPEESKSKGYMHIYMYVCILLWYNIYIYKWYMTRHPRIKIPAIDTVLLLRDGADGRTWASFGLAVWWMRQI